MSDFSAPPEIFARTFLPVYAWLIPRLNHLVDQGGTPTSWWRSVGLNAAVGGAPESQHLFGFAADLAARPGNLLALRNRAAEIGLIAVAEKDHLHVQVFPAGTLKAAGLIQEIQA